MSAVHPVGAAVRKPWYRILYVQVLLGIALGIAVGLLFPATGAALRPLGDAFINLVKMMIAPVIFCTVVAGIGSISDLRKVGRVGAKALLYFEVVSTFALVIGLAVGEVLRPGAGFNIDPASLDTRAVAGYVDKARGESVVDHLLALIPNSFFEAFARGDLLQVLLLAILTGLALSRLGERGQAAARALDALAEVFFAVIHLIVRLAPLGAFGAMAFTVGKYGASALVNLGALVLTLYVTALLFVLVVLGSIAWWCGFSILRFLAYIKEELLIVLGTSSSESALPQLMEKLEQAGCPRPIVGLVVPSGYSFNLDGTNIYMTLATLFLAQATNTPLTLGQELTILGVAMLTSKGASGVTGAGFITLAATLAVIPDIPVQSIAVLLGIDRFLSECRALTNIIGNGVATVAISRWEGELDPVRLNAALSPSASA